MDCNDIKPGMRIKTVAELSGTTGMLIKQEYIDNRRKDATGTVYSYVPGHGGDVWWVQHGDGKVAAYMFTEIEKHEGH